LSKSDLALMRRLAISAYGGLPAEQSTLPLQSFLNDLAPSVALLAASELARRNDHSCLPTYARLLDSNDFHTRHRSWSALKGLSGLSFNYDPAAESATRKASSRRWQEWSRGPDAAIRGKLPESTLIALFNGRDLSGWEIFENGKPAPESQSWVVRDELLISDGQARGDLRTTTRFENYTLTLDYKTHNQRGDGGIGIMLTEENEMLRGKPRPGGGSYLEVQLLPNRGGDIYVIGGFQAQANGKKIGFSNPRTTDVKDLAGQWNTMKLTVQNGTAEVTLNGTMVNRVSGGPTDPSKIVLRHEGDKISYRNLLIQPVEPRER
jgi:hypothetical protein